MTILKINMKNVSYQKLVTINGRAKLNISLFMSCAGFEFWYIVDVYFRSAAVSLSPSTKH